jgi:hypothetical protein
MKAFSILKDFLKTTDYILYILIQGIEKSINIQ